MKDKQRIEPKDVGRLEDVLGPNDPLLDQKWVTKVTNSDGPEVSVIGADVSAPPVEQKKRG